MSVIEELVPDERIVLTFRFGWRRHRRSCTLTFEDAAGGGTALRLDHEDITMEDRLDSLSVNVGWGQALAKLQAFAEPSTHEYRLKNTMTQPIKESKEMTMNHPTGPAPNGTSPDEPCSSGRRN